MAMKAHEVNKRFIDGKCATYVGYLTKEAQSRDKMVCKDCKYAGHENAHCPMSKYLEALLTPNG